MIRFFNRGDLDRFRNIIAGQFGLELGDEKLDFVAGALQRRLDAAGAISPGAYLDRLSTRAWAEELRELAAEVTIAETYFFRGSEQCRALAEFVLPERVRARGGVRRLRLLSAGCASGEEPFTLAIILRENFPELRSWDIAIRAIDVNPAMLAKARNGTYSAWSLRETPPGIRDKYFRPQHGDYVLDGEIRGMVSFEERNLAVAGSCSFPMDDGFDIVLCRNVLMYFVPESAQRVIAGIANALLPDGYLFVGYAETLRGLTQQFQLRHTNESFYYQKGAAGDGPPMPRMAPLYPPVTVPAASVPWMDAIEQVCGRIDALAQFPDQPESRRRSLPGPLPLPARARPVELGMAFELLHCERFHEALKLLDQLSPELTANVDVRLLRAILLANSGELGAAESICQDVLRMDGLNASAHYVAALCREHAGDANAAVEHDRAAIYLDATFAMPHLHLGRLAKRTAQLTTARYELQRAETLLVREEAPRILMFGGGFSREALLAFSRAELQACGEAL